MRRALLGLGLIACAPAAAPVQVTVEPLPRSPQTEPETKVATAASRGPIVLPSGLEIEDLRPGTGVEATIGQEAVVHYVGTLATTGVEFDSSRKRGRTPFVFRLGANRVIKGWDEGVAGMRVGQLRRLIIPPELAYGASGRPPTIPPGSTLVFEIELLEVRP